MQDPALMRIRLNIVSRKEIRTLADRPPIPADVQRSVRQRCAFGCVVCGLPIYEYHHIEDFSNSANHSADNLTLLCNQHHAEATKGLLTQQQVKAANENPRNISTGVTRPYGLHFQGENFEANIGSNKFTTGGLCDSNGNRLLFPVSIDDCDLFVALIDTDGNLFLSIQVFDECNLPLLVIQNNVMVVSTNKWDISFQATTLTIREQARDILFEVVFEPPNRIIIPRGRLFFNGIEAVIRKEYIFVVNSKILLSHNTMVGPVIGLQLGRNLRGFPAAVTCDPTKLKRYNRRRSTSDKIERDALTRQRQLLQKFESRFGGLADSG